MEETLLVVKLVVRLVVVLEEKEFKVGDLLREEELRPVEEETEEERLDREYLDLTGERT